MGTPPPERRGAARSILRPPTAAQEGFGPGGRMVGEGYGRREDPCRTEHGAFGASRLLVWPQRRRYNPRHRQRRRGGGAMLPASRWARAALLPLMLSVLLGACAAPAAPSFAPPPLAPATVRVGANIGASDVGVFLGMERGLFAQQGIEIDVVRGSGSDHVAAAATGELEVVAGAVNAGLLNAMGRDLPLRIVADKGSDPPGFSYQAFVVRKDLID